MARVGRRFAACLHVLARLALFAQMREPARRLKHVHACPWEPEHFVFAARFLSVFYQMLGFLTKSSHCNDFVEKPNCLRVLPAISGNHDTERQLNKQNRSSGRTAHFLADFFAFIARLTTSNLIIVPFFFRPSFDISSDCCEFDIVENTHSEPLPFQSRHKWT